MERPHDDKYYGQLGVVEEVERHAIDMAEMAERLRKRDKERALA